MNCRDFVRQQTLIFGAILVATVLVLPGSSRALETPDQVVYTLLKHRIGRTRSISVQKPFCDADGACTIQIRVKADAKRQALATVLLDKMATCETCKSYGDTDLVTIQVVDHAGNVEPPAAIEGATEAKDQIPAKDDELAVPKEQTLPPRSEPRTTPA